MWVLFGAVAAFAADPPFTEVCRYPDQHWFSAAELRLVDTATPFAYARWNADEHVDAILGESAANVPTFRATFSGDGLTVRADVNPDGADTVLRTTARVDLAPVAALAPGASVRVAGFSEGKPVIVPDADSVGVFDTIFGQATVGCDALTLRAPPEDLVGDALVAIGAPRDAPEVMVHGHGRVRVYATATTPRILVAFLPKSADDRYVRALTQQGAFTQIAVPTWGGVAWHGWIRTDESVSPETDTPGAGGLGMSGRGDRPQPALLACKDEQVLSVKTSSATTVVGRVAGGTPFRVLATSPDGPVVEFAGSWLWAAPGAVFVLPATSADCPAYVARTPVAGTASPG